VSVKFDFYSILPMALTDFSQVKLAI